MAWAAFCGESLRAIATRARVARARPPEREACNQNANNISSFPRARGRARSRGCSAQIAYRLLYPSIVIFGCLGIYLVNNNAFELTLAAIFAVLGYAFVKLECEPAPFLLGFVLGPMMEENLRRAMLVSRGDPMIFVERPICLAILLCAIALIVVMALPKIRSARETVRE